MKMANSNANMVMGTDIWFVPITILRYETYAR